MASEKQINFINTLINRKGIHTAMPIINRIAGNTSLEELSSGRASMIIGFLLEEEDFNEQAWKAAQQRGLNRYEQLVNWCKEQGIKGVRSRMKTTNIMKLIAQAGLIAPSELVREF